MPVAKEVRRAHPAGSLSDMSRSPRAQARSRAARGRRDIPLLVNQPSVGLEASGPIEAASATADHIGIDIDPVVSAGFIHDRYDLLVRGRAVSRLPIEELAISLDDVVVGRVQFGAGNAPEGND